MLFACVPGKRSESSGRKYSFRAASDPGFGVIPKLGVGVGGGGADPFCLDFTLHSTPLHSTPTPLHSNSTPTPTPLQLLAAIFCHHFLPANAGVAQFRSASERTWRRKKSHWATVSPAERSPSQVESFRTDPGSARFARLEACSLLMGEPCQLHLS